MKWSVACEAVVRPAAHGSRKVGGIGHRESSKALLRLRDSILGGVLDELLL